MGPDGVSRWVAEIMSAGWWIRYYRRGAMSSIGRVERAEAIRRMGEICRVAFSDCEDYEALLTAIVDALLPHDPRF
jgi:hypothetical protein